jgi:hypothetical protein
VQAAGFFCSLKRTAAESIKAGAFELEEKCVPCNYRCQNINYSAPVYCKIQILIDFIRFYLQVKNIQVRNPEKGIDQLKSIFV